SAAWNRLWRCRDRSAGMEPLFWAQSVGWYSYRNQRSDEASHSPSVPGALPGPGWWPVTVENLGAVGVPRGGGAVGVEDQGPAPSMDHGQVVEGTQKDAGGDAG